MSVAHDENAKAIELALDAWAAHERATGGQVPDFWDEYGTSEHLGEWLAAAGFCRAALRAAEAGSDGGR